VSVSEFITKLRRACGVNLTMADLTGMQPQQQQSVWSHRTRSHTYVKA